MKKARLFYPSKLPEARRVEILNERGGSYTFDFRNATPRRLFELSRGATEEALAVLCGRFVICYHSAEYGGRRMSPIREQFTASEWEKVKGVNFDRRIINHHFTEAYDNGLFMDYQAVCLTCGRAFSETPTAHKCGDAYCRKCGAVLKTKEEKRAGRCTACEIERLAKIHGYHDRPLKYSPVFESPSNRWRYLHGGVEIEIGGSFLFDTSSFARESSALVNIPFETPLVEYENDSSLGGGVECITQPTTLEGLEAKFDKFDAFYKKAEEMRGEFGVVNGLHIHLDRDFFKSKTDPDAIAKASVLIDLLVYKYYEFWAGISRREAGRFNYATKKAGVNSVISSASLNRSTGHCDAVNNGGEYTIEVRIFGGHIKTADDLLAVADIVYSLGKWAKATPFTRADKASPSDIVPYIKNPERVLAFIELDYHNRPATGLKERRDFVNALKKRIEKGGK